MPTECERSDVSLCEQQQQQQQLEAQQINQQQYQQHLEAVATESEFNKMEDAKDLATNGEMSTSQTSTTSTTSSTNGNNNTSNGGCKKSSLVSPDPTAYVAKARVTRPTPPPPSYNPMQFVQIKPSHLYQTAQQQLKKAEEVKKIKEIKKEEPEDWQNNLDNWKSSRRKRVEHIIDRVVEVKKLELEEHDRSRRKSKTFSEMIEERTERGARGRTKLASLAVYNEDESNDLSDLGIGTSSASGKSSLSEDYDNNSVMSDNVADLDKAIFESNNAQTYNNSCTNRPIDSNGITREYVSSPGYDTSSSTAPASSPDPCEYTYEGAIQDYKQRVSRAVSGSGNCYKPTAHNAKTNASKESTPERCDQTVAVAAVYPTRRGSKIEDRLIGFEVSSPSDSQECGEKQKVDVPKIDISKRKEIFEQQTIEPKSNTTTTNNNTATASAAPKVTLRERFNATASAAEISGKRDIKRMSGDMASIRDRLQCLEQQKNGTPSGNKLVEIPMPALKDRLSCLQNAVAKEEIKKKPVQLVDDRQLEIMKNEEENAKQRLKQHLAQQAADELIADIDTKISKKFEQQLSAATENQTIGTNAEEAQLNAAIAALALEEQQLEAAANAVNQIEAEFAELSDGALLVPPTETTNDVEFSVSDTNNLPKTICAGNNSGSFDQIGINSSCNNNNNNNNDADDWSKASQAPDVKVLGNIKTTTKLQRKPSNEMVHAKNLLKMFRDTFETDIELDESNEEVEKPVQKPIDISVAKEPPLIIKASKPNITQIPITPYGEKPSSLQPTPPLNAQLPQSPQPSTPSLIPRSMGHNFIGKPPMSPKSASKPKYAQSPLCSPVSPRKSESQFSINGRVEVFNSKNLDDNNQTPTVTTSRKSYLPHLKTNNNYNCNSTHNNKSHIELPTTALVTTSEPLSLVSELSSLEAVAGNVNGKELPLIGTTVNEPQVIRSAAASTRATTSTFVQQKALKEQQQQQQEQQQQANVTQSEVVICAPPVTILNPDELPKPNTVKALASCFSHDDVVDVCKTTPVSLSPNPMPRSLAGTKLPRQIPQTPPPQSPIATKRNILAHNFQTEEAREKPSTVIINKSSMTNATATNNDRRRFITEKETKAENLLKPNETLTPIVLDPAIEPHLVTCAPNASSLFKMANSQPSSPALPKKFDKPSEADIALCADFLNIMGQTIDFKNIETTPKLEHQTTVEEIVCEKVDVHKLPPGAITPCTGYSDVTQEDVDRCDGVQTLQALENKSTPKTFRKAEEFDGKKTDLHKLASPVREVDAKESKGNNSPSIEVARAAHSRALIETCERIIAEERLASSRLKSDMNSAKITPINQRKSKIPLARNIACCKGSESMNSKDVAFEPSISSEKANASQTKEEGPLIARLHVVETQIKVTTTSPPSSPKVETKKTQIPSPTTQPKKARNIFDFLKKNFGHHDETAVQAQEPSAIDADEKVVLKEDEIHTVDNSKFYLPADSELPPPLPLTPAPVNIEITKTITTDEILEAANTELALSREINDLLDDELNKLSLEKGASASGKSS